VIEPIAGLADRVVGMRAVGSLTMDDYVRVVVPALDRLKATHDRLRLLLHLGAEFTGFGEGAWGELTSAIRRTPFHKGAVVTDEAEIRAGLLVLKWVLRGDVRTFSNRDYDEAVRWVEA
jgi:hypothetical protein